jgi:cell shape-determining protein MreC
MNYLQRNRPKKNWLFVKNGLLIVFLFGLGVCISYFTKGPILSLTSRIWRAENTSTRFVSLVLSSLKSKSKLQSENEKLQRELESYRIRFLSSDIQVNSESLSDLILGADSYGGIVAPVLVHPPRTAYDSLIVDVGLKDGLRVGSKVILPEGPLVGEVSEVFARQAKIKLYSTPGEKVDVIIANGGFASVLVGEGGGSFRLSIPRDQEILIGDKLISRHLDERLVAIVEDVTMKPTDSFKDVLARTPANIFNLRFVLIIP